MKKLMFFILTLAFSQNSFSSDSTIIDGDYEIGAVEVTELSLDKNEITTIQRKTFLTKLFIR